MLGPAEALRDALHVGVDHHALRSVEGDAQHHVGGLAPDARELDELVERARHFAAVLADELLGEPDDVLRLLTEHPDAVQDLLDVVLLGARRAPRGRVGAKEIGRDAVDEHVGGLRREHRGHEELERVLVDELAVRVGMKAREPRERILGG